MTPCSLLYCAYGLLAFSPWEYCRLLKLLVSHNEESEPQLHRQWMKTRGHAYAIVIKFQCKKKKNQKIVHITNPVFVWLSKSLVRMNVTMKNVLHRLCPVTCIVSFWSNPMCHHCLQLKTSGDSLKKSTDWSVEEWKLAVSMQSSSE